MIPIINNISSFYSSYIAKNLYPISYGYAFYINRCHNKLFEDFWNFWLWSIHHNRNQDNVVSMNQVNQEKGNATSAESYNILLRLLRFWIAAYQLSNQEEERKDTINHILKAEWVAKTKEIEKSTRNFVKTIYDLNEYELICWWKLERNKILFIHLWKCFKNIETMVSDYDYEDKGGKHRTPLEKQSRINSGK